MLHLPWVMRHKETPKNFLKFKLKNIYCQIVLTCLKIWSLTSIPGNNIHGTICILSKDNVTRKKGNIRMGFVHKLISKAFLAGKFFNMGFFLYSWPADHRELAIPFKCLISSVSVPHTFTRSAGFICQSDVYLFS